MAIVNILVTREGNSAGFERTTPRSESSRLQQDRRAALHRIWKAARR